MTMDTERDRGKARTGFPVFFARFVWEHHRLSFICWLCFACPIFAAILYQALQQGTD